MFKLAPSGYAAVFGKNVGDWGTYFVESVKTIIGMKGAAFTMSCISEAQKSDCIDMLMYYDTSISMFCALNRKKTYFQRKK